MHLEQYLLFVSFVNELAIFSIASMTWFPKWIGIIFHMKFKKFYQSFWVWRRSHSKSNALEALHAVGRHLKMLVSLWNMKLNSEYITFLWIIFQVVNKGYSFFNVIRHFMKWTWQQERLTKIVMISTKTTKNGRIISVMNRWKFQL